MDADEKPMQASPVSVDPPRFRGAGDINLEGGSFESGASGLAIALPLPTLWSRRRSKSIEISDLRSSAFICG
jgi:hypothetical protein